MSSTPLKNTEAEQQVETSPTPNIDLNSLDFESEKQALRLSRENRFLLDFPPYPNFKRIILR